MARVPHIVRERKKSKSPWRSRDHHRRTYPALEVDARLESDSRLIPLGLAYVMEELEREVVSLAGSAHSRKADRDTPQPPRHQPGFGEACRPDDSDSGPAVAAQRRRGSARPATQIFTTAAIWMRMCSSGFCTGSPAATTSRPPGACPKRSACRRLDGLEPVRQGQRPGAA